MLPFQACFVSPKFARLLSLADLLLCCFSLRLLRIKWMVGSSRTTEKELVCLLETCRLRNRVSAVEWQEENVEGRVGNRRVLRSSQACGISYVWQNFLANKPHSDRKVGHTQHIFRASTSVSNWSEWFRINLFENRRMGNRTYTYDVHRWAMGLRWSVAVSFLSTQCQKCWLSAPNLIMRS